MKKSELQDLFKHLDKKDCDFLLSFAPSKLLDIQDAQLRLEFLKENFVYLDFFDGFRSNPENYLTISFPPEGSKRSPRFTRVPDNKKYLGDYFTEFGLNPQIEKILWFLDWPFSDFLTLFDPTKTFTDVTNEDLINALPIISSPCGIRRGAQPGYPSHYTYNDDLNSETEQLEPYEHLLVVDMRKRKSQLIDEFKNYIENEYKIKSETTKPFFKGDKTYLLWEPINDRIRGEAKVQLQIWKMRKEGFGFTEIGKKFSMDSDTARRAFYKAFDRSQGKSYDEQLYQEKFKNRVISTPDKSCKNCPDRVNCEDLCPEHLRYVDQDKKSSREKLLNEDSDKRKDYIIHNS